ncbi:D-amino-acid transaminase [Asticcacaulis excentricus]|uniref:Probable branched-chain-amino-acid aminotransferase n=1 Tax=Asticcacaulis excentricus TaxID=78587 RepID=A0A3G9G636_9CAUL|nr:D-amino-acid transaminase [Asticcacaulis excentricus]BBF82146.1 D-alanine aminotransferase [Asticcacaulis excentricus]
MSRIAYVNGAYVRHADAAVPIEDRGYQFADAVYEVWSVFGGQLADLAGHLNRLERSLRELHIAMPMPRAALVVVLNEVIRRNRIGEGLVYLQVSRGVAPRDHFFPTEPVKPALIITAKPVDRQAAEVKARKGIRVISAPDNRWGRCDIKTVGLLPNVLAKQAAREAGASDVIFVDAEGFVTEGGSANVYIVTTEGEVKTRSLRANILPGVTRISLLDILRAEGVDVSEGAFTLEEAKRAKEAFLSAASTFVMPIVQIDDSQIGDGVPGELSLRLREAYIQRARRSAGIDL